MSGNISGSASSRPDLSWVERPLQELTEKMCAALDRCRENVSVETARDLERHAIYLGLLARPAHALSSAAGTNILTLLQNAAEKLSHAARQNPALVQYQLEMNARLNWVKKKIAVENAQKSACD